MFPGLAPIQSEEGSESRAGLMATVLTGPGPSVLLGSGPCVPGRR